MSAELFWLYFLPFPASRSHPHSLACGPISPAMWSPTHAVTSLALSPTSLFPLLRKLVIALGLPRYSRIISLSQGQLIRNHVFLPCSLTWSQFQGVGHGHYYGQGVLFCLPQEHIQFSPSNFFFFFLYFGREKEHMCKGKRGRERKRERISSRLLVAIAEPDMGP